MRTSAGAGEAQNPDNLIVLPGVHVMAPADVENALAWARLLEGLSLHANAVLGAAPRCAPSSAVERLADIIGRIETLAGFVEEPALAAQGLLDVA